MVGTRRASSGANSAIIRDHRSSPRELRAHFNTFESFSSARALGMPPFQKSAVFLNIVQKAFDPSPPPLLFEHLSYFAGGVFSCGEFFK